MKGTTNDLKTVADFLETLLLFQSLKEDKWAKIEEQVQEDITPGSPSEDYIRPPDENKVLHLLQKDQEYLNLRNKIEEGLPLIKNISAHVQYDTHHKLDWLHFKNPLIGQSALEDAITAVEGLLNYLKT